MDYLRRCNNYLGLDGCRGDIRQSIRYESEKARMEAIKIEPITMSFNMGKCSVEFITKINPKDIIGVYFNDKKMTTVIKWKDGTITKVKAQIDKGDTYNPENGMAMAICKKAFGNKGNFNEVFKKWLPEEYKHE